MAWRWRRRSRRCVRSYLRHDARPSLLAVINSRDQTLRDVAERTARFRGSRRLDEQNTKTTLIEPVLRALGWNPEDLDEAHREFKPQRRDKPVDYALLDLGSPRLFVEAKGLGENLDDRRWAGQIMGYAGVAGVDWVLLTDGDQYRLYNAHAAVGVEEKLFRRFRVSEASALRDIFLANQRGEKPSGTASISGTARAIGSHGSCILLIGNHLGSIEQAARVP